MKLTDGEKLIILMLSDLYKKLDVKGEIDPAFISSAILYDHLWGIERQYSGIPFEPAPTPEIVDEVVRILDMWFFIEEGYQNLSNKDKSRLEKEASPFGKDPKFTGFDGNTETEYRSIALFLVKDLGRFESFKGRDFNSHVPSIDSYHRMLLVFEPMFKILQGQDLPVGGLIEILNAKGNRRVIKK